MITTHVLHPWRAMFWEPVSGTGERLMVGVVYRFKERWGSARIIRDDVLANLYGKSAKGLCNLIDTGLRIYRESAEAAESLERLSVPMFGLHPSSLRETEAESVEDLLRIAALLYSSLAKLDALDEAAESDQASVNEEATRQFGAAIRDEVRLRHPNLDECFGRSLPLVQGGQPARFGYASSRVLAHFNVLHPARQSSSMNDARARIFSLDRGKSMITDLPYAVLVSGVPPQTDAMLGRRQRESLARMRDELASEATSVGVLFRTAESPTEGASRLLELEIA